MAVVTDSFTGVNGAGPGSSVGRAAAGEEEDGEEQELRASCARGYPVAASMGRSLRRGASSPMRLSTSSASAR